MAERDGININEVIAEVAGIIGLLLIMWLLSPQQRKLLEEILNLLPNWLRP